MLYSSYKITKGISRMKDTKTRQPQIGEIYVMRFSGTGCEQNGLRPGLVFQNNVGNEYSPNIIALPLTTAMKKMSQPTHVLVSADDSGLRADSVVLCENPERLSKSRIGQYITKLSDEYMAKIAAANILASSAISFISPDALRSLWMRAVSLNTAR